MFRRRSKVLAALVALVFVLGIAAWAAVEQPTTSAKPGIAGKRAPAGSADRAALKQTLAQQRQGQAAADPQWRGKQIDPEARKRLAQFVSLTRLLSPPNPRQLQRLCVILSLTDEQKEQIKALYQQFFETVKPIGEERGEALKAVLEELKKPEPNKGQLQAAANQVFQADNQIVDAEFDFWIAFKGILSPEQQAAAAQFIEQKVQMELGGGGLGMRGGPPAPGAKTAPRGPRAPAPTQ